MKNQQSIRGRAFEQMRFTGVKQGWEPTVIPVAGEERWAVCMSKIDKYTGRKMYGTILAIYRYRRLAESLVADLKRAYGMKIKSECCVIC